MMKLLFVCAAIAFASAQPQGRGKGKGRGGPPPFVRQAMQSADCQTVGQAGMRSFWQCMVSDPSFAQLKQQMKAAHGGNPCTTCNGKFDQNPDQECQICQCQKMSQKMQSMNQIMPQIEAVKNQCLQQLQGSEQTAMQACQDAIEAAKNQWIQTKQAQCQALGITA